jgi:hypothetical protein
MRCEKGNANVRIREESASTTDAHKSYSSENTPGSSSSNDDDSTFATFHRPLSYLSGLGVSEVVGILRTVACLWAWGRPDNALGTWADFTLRLPSVRCSPEVPISKPAEGRLIGGGGPRPMDECSPKLSGSEGGPVGGNEMRACRLLALGEDLVGTAITLRGVRWRLWGSYAYRALTITFPRNIDPHCTDTESRKRPTVNASNLVRV